MATLLLGAAGAAIGGGFGGTVLGLSGAVIGRAVGATLGRVIDQRLLGAGSEPVETGRVDRFRLMGASEGAAVPRLWGRARIGAQVIWASNFLERQTTSGGGKGGPPTPEVTTFSYSVSLALALCEGPIRRIGRVWADGQEIDASKLTLRLYRGTGSQLPDPKIEAIEGAGNVPAYRGLAYVVIEDLELGPFGNRVPQFSFEVIRSAKRDTTGQVTDLREAVQAVALIPGTGEYALATTPVHYSDSPASHRSANAHSPLARTDLRAAVQQLEEEAPFCQSVSLVVSWFGDDLRCGSCDIRPKVEDASREGEGMVWRAGGIGRGAAQEVPKVDGRAIYGGTPADAAVIEAIAHLKARGQAVMFYPFILMDQLAGNTKPDPWSGAASQPPLPWRGRITLSQAPGRAGSPDGTAASTAEVAAFFGTASASDFSASPQGVISYTGPAEWRYRRFILHYAHLCAAAGGVDAFCIGSEMVGLTGVRGAGDSFPAVEALRTLAGEVRAILGPAVKISYAADWTEYAGVQRGASRYFHLDALWADPSVDFIGIDNYLPLSDWRSEDGHKDAGFGAIYNIDYLQANIAGGEYFDWYYDSAESEAAQNRKVIEDTAYGEPWVFRLKDLKSFWSLPHYNRIDGVREASPTAWVPGSKPIWFTEYGCPAVDKGSNSPNKFFDPKSSESGFPRASTGRRDDLIQAQYLRAMALYWANPENNPAASAYTGRMVDMSRAHVWAYDARPFPAFPRNTAVWGDGPNYARGHWLNGRLGHEDLAAIVAEICEAAGVTAYDVSGLYGSVRGFWRSEAESPRAALQPLMLAYGFDAVERDGVLRFQMREAARRVALPLDVLAVDEDVPGDLQRLRAPDNEMAGRVRLGFTAADGDYTFRQVEARFPEAAQDGLSESELPLVLSRAEAKAMAERWLSEARLARETARLALPPSRRDLGPGDVIALGGVEYRIDRMEVGAQQRIEAVRVDARLSLPVEVEEEAEPEVPFTPPLPFHAAFLDLPLLRGDEAPHAPYIALAAAPWPGSAALWSAPQDDAYALNRRVDAPAVMGVTESALPRWQAGLWDRGPALQVRLYAGTLASASEAEVLNGANLMAIGPGTEGSDWELFQFQTATLIAPNTYALSLRLRGQGGTEALIPESWAAGMQIVALNGGPQQIDLAPAALGLSRHYRLGLAAAGYADDAVRHELRSFRGVGLRPYAPAQLAVVPEGGDLRFTWRRRSRLPGDYWGAAEPPLGEASERYAVRVWAGTVLKRSTEVTAPEWLYTTAAQAADALSGAYTVEVAQISDLYGPGLWARLALTA